MNKQPIKLKEITETIETFPGLSAQEWEDLILFGEKAKYFKSNKVENEQATNN